MEPNGFEIVPYYMETNNKKENQMNNKPENWEVVEVSDNLLDNFSSFISYEVRSNRGHTVAKSLTQNDASLVASAPELLSACQYALGVLESIPEVYAEQIADILDESINMAMVERAIIKAEGK